jgi:hypothetical protein
VVVGAGLGTTAGAPPRRQSGLARARLKPAACVSKRTIKRTLRTSTTT